MAATASFVPPSDRWNKDRNMNEDNTRTKSNISHRYEPKKDLSRNLIDTVPLRRKEQYGLEDKRKFEGRWKRPRTYSEASNKSNVLGRKYYDDGRYRSAHHDNYNSKRFKHSSDGNAYSSKRYEKNFVPKSNRTYNHDRNQSYIHSWKKRDPVHSLEQGISLSTPRVARHVTSSHQKNKYPPTQTSHQQQQVQSKEKQTPNNLLVNFKKDTLVMVTPSIVNSNTSKNDVVQKNNTSSEKYFPHARHNVIISKVEKGELEEGEEEEEGEIVAESHDPPVLASKEKLINSLSSKSPTKPPVVKTNSQNPYNKTLKSRWEPASKSCHDLSQDRPRSTKNFLIHRYTGKPNIGNPDVHRRRPYQWKERNDHTSYYDHNKKMSSRRFEDHDLYRSGNLSLSKKSLYFQNDCVKDGSLNFCMTKQTHSESKSTSISNTMNECKHDVRNKMVSREEKGTWGVRPQSQLHQMQPIETEENFPTLPAHIDSVIDDKEIKISIIEQSACRTFDVEKDESSAQYIEAINPSIHLQSKISVKPDEAQMTETLRENTPLFAPDHLMETHYAGNPKNEKNDDEFECEMGNLVQVSPSVFSESSLVTTPFDLKEAQVEKSPDNVKFAKEKKLRLRINIPALPSVKEELPTFDSKPEPTPLQYNSESKNSAQNRNGEGNHNEKSYETNQRIQETCERSIAGDHDLIGNARNKAMQKNEMRSTCPKSYEILNEEVSLSANNISDTYTTHKKHSLPKKKRFMASMRLQKTEEVNIHENEPIHKYDTKPKEPNQDILSVVSTNNKVVTEGELSLDGLKKAKPNIIQNVHEVARNPFSDSESDSDCESQSSLTSSSSEDSMSSSSVEDISIANDSDSDASMCSSVDSEEEWHYDDICKVEKEKPVKNPRLLQNDPKHYSKSRNSEKNSRLQEGIAQSQTPSVMSKLDAMVLSSMNSQEEKLTLNRQSTLMKGHGKQENASVISTSTSNESIDGSKRKENTIRFKIAKPKRAIVEEDSPPRFKIVTARKEKGTRTISSKLSRKSSTEYSRNHKTKLTPRLTTNVSSKVEVVPRFKLPAEGEGQVIPRFKLPSKQPEVKSSKKTRKIKKAKKETKGRPKGRPKGSTKEKISIAGNSKRKVKKPKSVNENNHTETNAGNHWVRRSVRQPCKSHLSNPNVKILLVKLRNNDADMQVLKLKKFLGPDTPQIVMDAVLDGLEENSNCQALYIQNFNEGMRDKQMLRLLEVLKKRTNIWCINIGETYHVKPRTWEKFTKGLKKTYITHLYASEHTISNELKVKMREMIRLNRKKHDFHINPNNLEIIIQCTHCWWNPINAKSLRPHLQAAGKEYLLADRVTLGLPPLDEKDITSNESAI